MKQLHRRPSAIGDLIATAEHLNTINPSLAERFLAGAESTFKHLAQFPELGASRESSKQGLEQLRLWRVEGLKNI